VSSSLTDPIEPLKRMLLSPIRQNLTLYLRAAISQPLVFRFQSASWLFSAALLIASKVHLVTIFNAIGSFL
jgi:hypothetical protein